MWPVSTSVRRYRAHMDLEQRARTCLRMMAREIRCALVPASASQGASDSEEGGVEALVEAPFPYFRSDSDGAVEWLTVGGLTPPDSVPGVPKRVAWRFDASEGVVQRRESPAALRKSSESRAGEWLTAVRGVESLSFTYYDGRDWKDAWDSDTEAALPRAVRIELKASDDTGGSASMAIVARTLCKADQWTSAVETPDTGSGTAADGRGVETPTGVIQPPAMPGGY